MLRDHAVLADVDSMHEAEKVSYPSLRTLAEPHCAMVVQYTGHTCDRHVKWRSRHVKIFGVTAQMGEPPKSPGASIVA